ncbi:MAG: type IX secretion system outer membrane channel protein PorV [Bacteroidales bacterium]|jgi:hypothetical protein|nr:type IX secretion system outer membrane channel protein PorV [Bacteroidales bacterium]
MKKRSLLTLLLISLIFNFVYAQVPHDPDYKEHPYLNTITTAVPFLQIAPDSRSGAMGDIGVATSADPSAQNHNPAKYVYNKNRFGVSFSYSPWLHSLVNDVSLLSLSGYYRITRMDAIAMSLRYFGLGEINFTTDRGDPLGTYKPNEFSIDFTYARKLIDELSIAITPRFIYSDLTAGQSVGQMETSPGMAGAADISLFYQQDFESKKLFNQTVRVGLNIQNLGNKIKYTDEHRRDFIPSNLKLGIGYTMEFDEYNALSIAMDINKLLVPTPAIYRMNYATDTTRELVYGLASESVGEGIFHSFYDAPGGFREEMREITIGIGLEYSYRNLLFIRGGYFYENPYKGGRNFFTVGAGIKYNIIGIDMAYLIAINQHHPLENSLRFSLTFDLISFDKKDVKQQGKNPKQGETPKKQ